MKRILVGLILFISIFTLTGCTDSASEKEINKINAALIKSGVLDKNSVYLGDYEEYSYSSIPSIIKYKIYEQNGKKIAIKYNKYNSNEKSYYIIISDVVDIVSCQDRVKLSKYDANCENTLKGATETYIMRDNRYYKVYKSKFLFFTKYSVENQN